MLIDLPFRLKRLSGVFSDPALTKALFASQVHIRSWRAIDQGLPLFVEDWELSGIEEVCFSVAPLSRRGIACSIPMRKKFLQENLKTIVVRSGSTGADIIYNLTSYPALESLSICMPHRSNVSQTKILARINVSAPKLKHLTFWTFGAGPWLDKPQLVSKFSRFMLSILSIFV